MIDPAIDRQDEPFCYFSKPTDEIGVMDGKEGTLITPEGYLYTGSGELMFFTGNPLEPVTQRVKTLAKGYLPVIEYKFQKDSLLYSFQIFASTLDGRPESPLINFIKVTIKNNANDKRAAFFGAGVRYQNDENTDWQVGDNRFGRPWKAKKLGEFEQAGDSFNVNWKYSFTNDVFMRDERMVYLFQKDSIFQQMMTLKTGYNEPYNIEPKNMKVLPTTPVGIVQYRVTLKPKEERSIYLRFPYLTISRFDALVEEIRHARHEDYYERTVKFWDELFSKGINISVPEEKVNNTFKANLVYDLIARNKEGNDYIQKVNEFQYDAFWLRDASSILRMYDISGYHEIARQVLDFFPNWQQPDGNFVSQGGQYDAWGQVMWAYGQHYLLTRDKDYVEKIYPSIKKAVDWLINIRKTDSLNLIPVTTPGDNEDITGHVTGHNFLALDGLKNVIVLAEALGKSGDIKEYKRLYDDYYKTFISHLKNVVAKTGGYIPPGMDKPGGQDWGNMQSLYPEIILDPFAPMVTATLNKTRSKYQEGIMTYGNGRYLHHYITMFNTQSEIIRDEQEKALGEFYAELMHTGSTHTGFEYAIWPWSNRDFGMNLTPHGWFSAEFRTLLRNMMVREEKNDLHLFSIISPEWVKDKMSIKLEKAPTIFGEV
ncbi:MAG: hypothetical protein ACM3MI_01175, partial [Clostridiales bacterium]